MQHKIICVAYIFVFETQINYCFTSEIQIYIYDFMKPFTPHDLPLKKLDWKKFRKQIGPANRALARYDGILQSIPNPAVLLSPLTTQEAVLSSKIEGTQATLEEVLKYEADPKRQTKHYQDIQEVINYRKAMAYAVEELHQRPISLNLLKRIHSILLDSVRGQNKNRGNFRKIQNWIGKPGASQKEARYVPPDPLKLPGFLDKFEKYIHHDDDDIIVQVAIIHAQFEILHPFLDGNGRIGRILIPLFFYSKGVLHRPMFYISAFLEANRPEYYDKLKDISDNNSWEEWITFFLKAVINQANRNTDKAQQILELYNNMKQKIVDYTHSQYALQALDGLFTIPIFSSRDFQNHSDIPKASSARIINVLKDEGVITTIEEARGSKPALYQFQRLIDIVNQ